MNYRVEDLSSLRHMDDLMSGFVDTDEVFYGTNGNRNLNFELDPNDAEPLYVAPTNTRDMPKIDPELIKAGISTAGTLIGLASGSSKKTELDRAIKTACGKRPMIGKERKESYRMCALNVLESYGGGGRSMNNQTTTWSDDSNTQKGMSTGAIVGIGVGVLAIGTLIVLLVRKK